MGVCWTTNAVINEVNENVFLHGAFKVFMLRYPVSVYVYKEALNTPQF